MQDTRSKLIEAQVELRKKSEAIQVYVFEGLSIATARFLVILSYIIEDASDGWLPQNEKEFFSRRTVQLICRELNADGPARVTPSMPWFAYFSRNITEYKAALGEVVKSHGPQLDRQLIAAISKVEGSTMFWTVPQWSAARANDKDARRFPPILCPFETDRIVSDFEALADLYRHIRSGLTKFQLHPLQLPLPRKSPGLGKNRFTPDQLNKWQTDQHMK